VSVARTAALLLPLLIPLLGPAPAVADETDYLPDNLNWNGLSELESLAHGHQLQLEVLEELDWARLAPGSTLMVLYPLTALDSAHLLAFLEGGGRLLLADDFGVAGPLLGEFGITRQTDTVRTDRHHDGNPNLPVAGSLTQRHQINTGVGEVVANHPAYFRSKFPTLVGFGDGQQLLVAGSLKKGRIVALSDPSVLINGMLRFSDNETLANNLLRYLSPVSGNRIYVLTRHFRVRGAPASEAGRQRGSTFQRFLIDYSKFLGRANDFAAEGHWFRVLAIVAGGVALVALLVVVPLPRRDLRGHWLRPAASGATWNVDLASAGQRPGSTAVAAAVFREEVDELLTAALDAPGPIFTVHPKWVAERARTLGGDEAARLCMQLLSSMKHLTPPSATQLSAPVGVRRRDLAQMYERCRRLLKLLGSAPLPDVSSASTTESPLSPPNR
jgi:Domain of unknown function (DUF4350)